MDARINIFNEEILNGIDKYNELTKADNSIKYTSKYFKHYEYFANRYFDSIVDFISDAVESEAVEYMPDEVKQFTDTINVLLELAYMAGQMNKVVDFSKKMINE